GRGVRGRTVPTMSLRPPRGRVGRQRRHRRATPEGLPVPVTTDQREQRRPPPPPAPRQPEPVPAPPPQDEPSLPRAVLAVLLVWTMALALVVGRGARRG